MSGQLNPGRRSPPLSFLFENTLLEHHFSLLTTVPTHRCTSLTPVSWFSG